MTPLLVLWSILCMRLFFLFFVFVLFCFFVLFLFAFFFRQRATSVDIEITTFAQPLFCFLPERVLSLYKSLKEWCCVVFHAKKHYGQCLGFTVVTLAWSVKKQIIFSFLEQALLRIGRGFTLLGINSILMKLQIGRMVCICLEKS